MHFSLPAIFFLATSAVALPQLSARDGTAGIIGVFDDSSCTSNQRDLSGGDKNGECRELPGQSLKIWWLKKGCGVVTIQNRDCKGQGVTMHREWNECIDTKNLLSWEIYCDP